MVFVGTTDPHTRMQPYDVPRVAGDGMRGARIIAWEGRTRR